MFKKKIFELNNINFINYFIIKEDRHKIGINKLNGTRTQKILATKDGETKYIKEIVSWIINEVEKKPLIIIPYPSTDKDKNQLKQLPNIIAQEMHKYYKNWVDGSGFLTRKYSLPKNTRDETEQYKSLIIKNKKNLKKKNILLLDDVTSSGSSLLAGLKKLRTVKPKKLKALAVAKKVYLKDIPLSKLF